MKKFAFMVLLAGFVAAPYYVQAEPPAAATSSEKAGHDREKLSPEAQEAMRQHKEAMDKISPAVKEELKNYKSARKALYEKLSLEAKQTLKDLRKNRKDVSPAVKKEIKEFRHSKGDDDSEQQE